MESLRVTTIDPDTGSPRLQVLLTEDRPQPAEHWTHQIPRLLKPMGVTTVVARSGQEAIGLAEQGRFHAAVIDWATPWAPGRPTSQESTDNAKAPGAPEGESPQGRQALSQSMNRRPVGSMGARKGHWLLEVFERLPHRPPVVVIKSRGLSPREETLLLHESVRLGVFSVLDKPVHIEQLLAVLRRLIDRRYKGTWPS